MRPLCDTVHPRPHCVGIKMVLRVELEMITRPSRILKFYNYGVWRWHRKCDYSHL